MADVQQNQDAINARNEKKARKAMEKLGLTPVEGFSRVVFRRPKGMMLAISEPQVFKSSDEKTYVVLGEAKTEDLNQQAQQAAAERLRMAEGQAIPTENSAQIEAPATEETEEEEVDEAGIDAKDIELVMGQALVSRSVAVKALKKHDNDIVNTIMSLTA